MRIKSIRAYFTNHTIFANPRIMKKNTPQSNAVKAGIYSYHAMPGGDIPKFGEIAPNIRGERYNYDRMQLILENINFFDKSVIDIGCNSGWFCREIQLHGAAKVFGVDDNSHPEMGGGLDFAQNFHTDEKSIVYIDFKVRGDNVSKIFELIDLESIDIVLALSVMHHIPDRRSCMKFLLSKTKCGIIYEDENFWNVMYNSHGERIQVSGSGHRYDWDQDLTWKRKINSLEFHEQHVLTHYGSKLIRDQLGIDGNCEIEFWGFSEKRRPILFIKPRF